MEQPMARNVRLSPQIAQQIRTPAAKLDTADMPSDAATAQELLPRMLSELVKGKRDRRWRVGRHGSIAHGVLGLPAAQIAATAPCVLCEQSDSLAL
ncbi:hypothetical protein BFF78_37605 [Streptomyces fodineus]|uniref:Uncharacterized protein n=1 Tax=Streptomyces fodineus TaxID=1904616 RepID=A0A1D7YKC9_9ACTN|nr:hypothetical protein [Streptomyces fodineus]AOR36011.1 hypothetical protein BFF78_37605 [Streptomyces fodineus]